MKKGKRAVMEAQFWKALRKAVYEDKKTQSARSSAPRMGEAA